MQPFTYVSKDEPAAAIKEVSWDRTLRRPILLKDGRRLTALELQWQLPPATG